MRTAFIIIIVAALLPQIVFSAFYWRRIPEWIRNPYGRLAQLGAWCHIILLTLYLVFVLFGRHLNPLISEWLLVLAFVPLVIYGVLQLILLKKAIDSSVAVHHEESKESK